MGKRLKGYDITDAHIDFYARFTPNNKLFIGIENNPKLFDYQVTRQNKVILNELQSTAIYFSIIEIVAPNIQWVNTVNTQFCC